MANASILKPRNSDIYLISTGDTGSKSFYAVNDKTQRYALPGTNTQTISVEFSGLSSVSHVAVIGMNAYPTLTMSLYNSATESVQAGITGSTYAAEDRAKQTWNAMWSITPEDADAVQIGFSTTGCTSFQGVFVGTEAWKPAIDYDIEAEHDNSPKFTTVETGGGSYSYTRSHLQEHTLTWSRLTTEERKDLEFAKGVIGDDACILMLDSGSTHHEDWVWGQLDGGASKVRYSDIEQQTIKFKELVKCIY